MFLPRSAASYRAAKLARVQALLLAEVAALSAVRVVRTLVRRAVRGPLRPGWPVRTELAQAVMRAVLMRSKRRGIPWLRAAQAALPTKVKLSQE